MNNNDNPWNCKQNLHVFGGSVGGSDLTSSLGLWSLHVLLVLGWFHPGTPVPKACMIDWRAFLKGVCICFCLVTGWHLIQGVPCCMVPLGSLGLPAGPYTHRIDSRDNRLMEVVQIGTSGGLTVSLPEMHN